MKKQDKQKDNFNTSFIEIIQFIQNEKVVSKKNIASKFDLSTDELEDILHIFDNHGYL